MGFHVWYDPQHLLNQVSSMLTHFAVTGVYVAARYEGTLLLQGKEPISNDIFCKVLILLYRLLSASMGSILSRAKVLIGAVYHVNGLLDVVGKRLKKSPGIPVHNTGSPPFWTVPKAEIPDNEDLPKSVDIVIIGTGITGTSFAYNVFQNKQSLSILMLDARDVCSGATGRYVIPIHLV